MLSWDLKVPSQSSFHTSSFPSSILKFPTLSARCVVYHNARFIVLQSGWELLCILPDTCVFLKSFPPFFTFTGCKAVKPAWLVFPSFRFIMFLFAINTYFTLECIHLVAVDLYFLKESHLVFTEELHSGLGSAKMSELLWPYWMAFFFPWWNLCCY